MAKTIHPKIEFEPDAWERFERAVDVVAKSPPQHRTKTVPPKSKKHPKKRALKGKDGD
jgi:hypothetical protein